MIRNLIVTLAIAGALALTACGGDAKPKSEPKATATTASVPRVSEATICGILFDSDDDPLGDAANIVGEFAQGDADPMEIDTQKTSDTMESIESLALRAPTSIEPHLTAEAATLKELLDAHDNPRDGQTLNFETFKSSGLEIINVCTPYL